MTNNTGNHVSKRVTDINVLEVAHNPIRVIVHIVARDKPQQVKSHHKIFAKLLNKLVFNITVNFCTGHCGKISSEDFIF
jgi:hypothetical protein